LLLGIRVPSILKVASCGTTNATASSHPVRHTYTVASSLSQVQHANDRYQSINRYRTTNKYLALGIDINLRIVEQRNRSGTVAFHSSRMQRSIARLKPTQSIESNQIKSNRNETNRNTTKISNEFAQVLGCDMRASLRWLVDSHHCED
jgi:hypothetical protein